MKDKQVKSETVNANGRKRKIVAQSYMNIEMFIIARNESLEVSKHG